MHYFHNTSCRNDLRNSAKAFAADFESLSVLKKLLLLFLHGDSRCKDNQNNYILSTSINYIKKTKRFDYSLFD